MGEEKRYVKGREGVENKFKIYETKGRHFEGNKTAYVY